MSQEKKTQVDDLTKLRRILDNSSDPTFESLLLKNAKTLESVRRRLRGDSLKTPSRFAGFFPRSTSMEPRVYIHEIKPVTPRFIIPPPNIEPSPSLPKFELVSESKPIKQVLSQDISFDSEDLFEVEKAEIDIPEFVEVTPLEHSLPSEETEQQRQYDDTSAPEQELPEWQPVTEEESKPSEPDEHLIDEAVPEFQQVNVPITPEKPEDQPEKEPLPGKQKPVGLAVGGSLEEPTEPSFQILSKSETREVIRAKRAKEHQAKKLQKIERKRLKKEQKIQERLTRQTLEEQPFGPPPQQHVQVASETGSTTETPWIKVNFNAFKGIESIDEKTAEMLYTHGYFSIENIKDATLNDLVQIRGIGRKLAKQIKKEIEHKIIISDSQEFVPLQQKTTKKKSTKSKLRDTAEWESYPMKKKLKQSSSTVCTYKGYTLFKRDITSRNRKKTTIHFFSRKKPTKGRPAQLPEGYHIAINKKTGVPYLKKIR
ncbi:hypothetical protein AYK25_08115 [Thermoplasmatales archaeon SM1-50]|nr:MAG: hypothetical protein AYK25_08115 [Thermoplasmatales archaeon SM1-50]